MAHAHVSSYGCDSLRSLVGPYLQHCFELSSALGVVYIAQKLCDLLNTWIYQSTTKIFLH